MLEDTHLTRIFANLPAGTDETLVQFVVHTQPSLS